MATGQYSYHPVKSYVLYLNKKPAKTTLARALLFIAGLCHCGLSASSQGLLVVFRAKLAYFGPCLPHFRVFQLVEFYFQLFAVVWLAVRIY